MGGAVVPIIAAVAGSLVSSAMAPKPKAPKPATVPAAEAPASVAAAPGSQAADPKESTAGSAAPTSAEISADSNARRRRGRVSTILTGAKRLQTGQSDNESLGG